MYKKTIIPAILIVVVMTLPLMSLTKVPNRVEMFKTACNTYLYIDKDGKNAIIIDPGSKSSHLEKIVKSKNLKILAIFNTHGHGDHIFANKYYSDLYNVDIYAYPGDERGYINKYKKHKPTKLLNPKDDGLTLGTINIKILHTPGHSKGSMGILIENYLFSGDTLFFESIGRTWGKKKKELTKQEIDGIKNKFLLLPGDTLVFPGHGPSTTIKHEIIYNPFLN